METNVQNIGVFNYFFTILTGRNRRIVNINKAIGNLKNNFDHQGDYLVTIGRSAIIITVLQGNKRVPVIVKKWNEKKAVKNVLAEIHGYSMRDTNLKTFIDSDGLTWEYFSSKLVGERLTLFESHNVKYDLDLR